MARTPRSCDAEPARSCRAGQRRLCRFMRRSSARPHPRENRHRFSRWGPVAVRRFGLAVDARVTSPGTGIENCYARSTSARRYGVAAIPGAGRDVETLALARPAHPRPERRARRGHRWLHYESWLLGPAPLLVSARRAARLTTGAVPSFGSGRRGADSRAPPAGIPR